MHTLPDSARVWIFTTSRHLTSDERETLTNRVRAFLDKWASHGRSVRGAAEVRQDRFLVVAAHLDGGVSGCGIDSLVHTLDEIARALGFEWLDGLHVAYRDADGTVRTVDRPAFRTLVREGTITAEASVFVTTLDTLAELHDEGLERPAGETWHARVFRIPEPA